MVWGMISFLRRLFLQMVGGMISFLRRSLFANGLGDLSLPPSAFPAAGLTDLLFGGLAGIFSIVIVFQGANLQLFTGFLPDLFRTFAVD